jgi:hypothetical protein
MHLRLYSEFLSFLCQHRFLWEIFSMGGSYGTIALELSFPMLVWNRRLRPYLIMGAVALHLGIGLLMGLATFSLFMMSLLVSFIPGSVVRQVMRTCKDWLLGVNEASAAMASNARREAWSLQPH